MNRFSNVARPTARIIGRVIALAAVLLILVVGVLWGLDAFTLFPGQDLSEYGPAESVHLLNETYPGPDETALYLAPALPTAFPTALPQAAYPPPVDIPNPYPSPDDSNPEPVPADWRVYASPNYRLSLRYPPNWQATEESDTFLGEDGFFRLSQWDSGRTGLGESLDVSYACAVEAGAHPATYGPEPNIRQGNVARQAACYIQTSLSLQAGGRSAMILARPGEPAGFLILETDPLHFEQITASLEFLPNP